MTFPLYTAVTLWLLACTALDWRTRHIPLALTLPALVAGAGWAVARGAWLFLAFWALIYTLWWMQALGGGDAKILMALTALRPDIETTLVLLGALALGGAGVLTWNAARLPRPVLLAAVARIGAGPDRAVARALAESLDRRKLAGSGRWRATGAILIGWLALGALAYLRGG